jgi:putative transposase
MEGNLKGRAHSFGQNAYHFIWAPKYRIKLLKPRNIRRVCDGALRMIAMQHAFLIHQMKVTEDHIHIFIEIPPRISVSKAFQLLKGKSSRILRRNFKWLRKFDHMWSKGKFYRSIGNVTMNVIDNYISRSQGSWDYFDTRRYYSAENQVSLASF